MSMPKNAHVAIQKTSNLFLLQIKRVFKLQFHITENLQFSTPKMRIFRRKVFAVQPPLSTRTTIRRLFYKSTCNSE